MFTVSKAPPFSLPDETIGRATVILAQRGGGKTYLAMMLAESMLEQEKQLAILDPTGVWYGLTSSADGKSAGIPILVMGGAHGDVPLEPTAGAVVARFIVATGSSVIMDLSAMPSNAAQDRFATDFAEALYRLKSVHRSPLLLVADEADSFAPQKPQRGQERMLGAFDQITRRGRAYGLGVMLISQRPAVLNKNCLSQADVLMCGRVTGRRDFDALKSWTDLYGDAPEFSASVPGLQTGEFWVWSPSWLNVFKRVKVCKRRTYDSSASPTAETASGNITRAAVDLKKLSAEIAATAEAAAANDPAKLRAKIRELESFISNMEPQRVEVPVLTDEDRAAMKAATDALLMAHGYFTSEQFAALTRPVVFAGGSPVPEAIGERFNPPAGRPAQIPAPPPAPARDDGTGVSLSKCERAILTVLAQHAEKGQSVARDKLALLSRYSGTSSSFANAIGSLKGKLYILSEPAGYRALPTGIKALGPFQPLPTGREAVHYWINELSKCEGEILTVLLQYSDLTKEEIAGRTASNYSPTSSSFANALGALRTRGLVTREKRMNIIIP